jgi:hypothetical protein
MHVIEREFTNELGNRIKITIEGPNSVSENILTLMEFNELQRAMARPPQSLVEERLRADMTELRRVCCARIEELETTSIPLTRAEIQSGHNRVQWAENLIRQLPIGHNGRDSWLLNYGTQGAGS